MDDKTIQSILEDALEEEIPSSQVHLWRSVKTSLVAGTNQQGENMKQVHSRAARGWRWERWRLPLSPQSSLSLRREAPSHKMFCNSSGGQRATCYLCRPDRLPPRKMLKGFQLRHHLP